MNRIRKAKWLAASLVLVIVIVGCGGSESGSTASSPTISKDSRRKSKLRWEWHATVACKKGMEQADVVMHKAAGKPVPAPPSAAPDWEGFKLPVRVLLPTFRQTTGELEEVEPDKQDVYDYEQILKRFRLDLRQAEKNPGAPISSRPLASAGKAAYVYGIHACLY
jgi:hypothetical protein